MKLTEQNLILIDCKECSKDLVIDKLAELMVFHNRATDKKSLVKDIHLREEESSTSMGMGIAIPHARSHSVKHSSLLFMKLKEPIDWDESRVNLVFGIFVPEENKENEHLKILSRLARKLINLEFLESLQNTNNREEILELLELT